MGVVGNLVHSVGDPLSDNLLYVPGSTGHGIGGTSSTALLNRLDAGAPLLDMDPNDFLPIDEALQLLGASQLLNVYDGDESDQTINGTNDNDTLNGGSGNDYVNGGGGLETVVIDATRDAVSDVRRDGALLHKSGAERISPFLVRIYPTATVTGMPSAV